MSASFRFLAVSKTVVLTTGKMRLHRGGRRQGLTLTLTLTLTLNPNPFSLGVQYPPLLGVSRHGAALQLHGDLERKHREAKPVDGHEDVAPLRVVRLETPGVAAQVEMI